MRLTVRPYDAHEGTCRKHRAGCRYHDDDGFRSVMWKAAKLVLAESFAVNMKPTSQIGLEIIINGLTYLLQYALSLYYLLQ